MKGKLLYLCCRVRVEAGVVRERLGLCQALSGEAGLGKLAITVILLGVGVALTLAVVYVIGPAIMNLANRTGESIESVPLDWGQ